MSNTTLLSWVRLMTPVRLTDLVHALDPKVSGKEVAASIFSKSSVFAMSSASANRLAPQRRVQRSTRRQPVQQLGEGD